MRPERRFGLARSWLGRSQRVGAGGVATRAERVAKWDVIGGMSLMVRLGRSVSVTVGLFSSAGSPEGGVDGVLAMVVSTGAWIRLFVQCERFCGRIVPSRNRCLSVETEASRQPFEVAREFPPLERLLRPVVLLMDR